MKKSREKFSWISFKAKLKRTIFGMKFMDGLLYKIIIYLLLVSFSYIYLYPILFMFINSLKSVDDLINPGVIWVPHAIEWTNYKLALQVVDFSKSVFTSTGYVLKVSLAATVSACLIGYGFARFNFPGKKLFFALMITTFILPSQVMSVANMLNFRKLGLMSTQWSMILPALTGQGLNAAIFILIFYQFYKTIPNVLFESAEIDGANQFKIFFKVALPLSIPSFIIVFLFSFVWYWNETFITSLYVGGNITMPLQLQAFQASWERLVAEGSIQAHMNEAIMMAGNMVTIFPLLLLYFIGQRFFTESIDRTGITGE